MNDPINPNADLEFAPGATLDEDPDAPMRFAVWLDGDIIGAGDTREAAIEDARAQVLEWETNARVGTPAT